MSWHLNKYFNSVFVMKRCNVWMMKYVLLLMRMLKSEIMGRRKKEKLRIVEKIWKQNSLFIDMKIKLSCYYFLTHRKPSPPDVFLNFNINKQFYFSPKLILCQKYLQPSHHFPYGRFLPFHEISKTTASNLIKNLCWLWNWKWALFWLL